VATRRAELPPPEVLAWPDAAHRVAEGWAENGLVIIGVNTPSTTIRHVPRAATREALREVLGLLLGCAPDAVRLASTPGMATRLELPGTPIRLSISHESALSIAAICCRGTVGVDLMRIDADMEWESVAADYLGPQACSRIANAPFACQAQAFAREWTRLEASLKCLGMALAEWQPGMEKLLRQLTVMDLTLPEGFAGAVALSSLSSLSNSE
jgi:4'-phosphopantetheinyl transferase